MAYSKIAQAKYWRTFKGRKSQRRCKWKKRGVILQIPFDTFYQTYLNKKECDFCGVLLTVYPVPRNNNTKVLDHCHITGKVRGVLCHKCNITKQ